MKEKTKEKLSRISAVTIDRLLVGERRKFNLKKDPEPNLADFSKIKSL